MAFNPSNLRFDAAGLIPAIAQDEATDEVLMLAWMNADSLKRTLDTRRVTYWSRSAARYGRKGPPPAMCRSLSTCASIATATVSCSSCVRVDPHATPTERVVFLRLYATMWKWN